ncbi:MAG: YcxB family protein [Lachnospiraceae bacterium]|nr:YcxB family protein [Lachnospiraceae bacterium]
MRHIYRSLAGICNIILTAAIILLTAKLWNPQEPVLMVILILCCVLFPVMQPLLIYLRAVKQMEGLPKDMVLEFSEAGLLVTAGEQKSHVPWKGIRGVIKQPGMTILVAEAGRGYMLTDEMLGAQKDTFLAFVETMKQDEK